MSGDISSIFLNHVSAMAHRCANTDPQHHAIDYRQHGAQRKPPVFSLLRALYLAGRPSRWALADILV